MPLCKYLLSPRTLQFKAGHRARLEPCSISNPIPILKSASILKPIRNHVSVLNSIIIPTTSAALSPFPILSPTPSHPNAILIPSAIPIPTLSQILSNPDPILNPTPMPSPNPWVHFPGARIAHPSPALPGVYVGWAGSLRLLKLL